MMHALASISSGRRLAFSLFNSSARTLSTGIEHSYEGLSKAASRPISFEDPAPYSVNVLEGTTGRIYGRLLALGE